MTTNGNMEMLATFTYFVDESTAIEGNFFRSSDIHRENSGHAYFITDDSTGDIIKGYNEQPSIEKVYSDLKEWAIH